MPARRACRRQAKSAACRRATSGAEHQTGPPNASHLDRASGGHDALGGGGPGKRGLIVSKNELGGGLLKSADIQSVLETVNLERS